MSRLATVGIVVRETKIYNRKKQTYFRMFRMEVSMSKVVPSKCTYSPLEQATIEALAKFLARQQQIHLCCDTQGDVIELPKEMQGLLKQVADAMLAGKSVTVAPQNRLLTTQQAADLLGVSRPTVVKMIEDQVLPATTPAGKRRMLLLEDVLDFQRMRRQQQYAALFASELDDYETEDDLKILDAYLKKVRSSRGRKMQDFSRQHDTGS